MPVHINISSLFRPKSVVIVGASHSPKKIGSVVLHNLLQSGFNGEIFPINPKGGMILGIPALSKISDIPEPSRPIDLAVLCLPAAKIAASLKELGEISTKAAIIVSSGFKETGAQGLALEQEIIQLAHEYDIAILGPNCLGLANTSTNLNATFAVGAPLPGNIGFFSQSGSLCAAIFDWARTQNIGFSSFISLGNKALLDESDILGYLANDPKTKVILGYLESVESGARFLRNAHIATRKKPVILLKAGRTSAGAQAASSHTGALTGEDLAYEAAFKQTGIIRAEQTEDLLIMAKAFAVQPLPKGPGVAIVTNAGGPGIIATDACETEGLQLAQLSSATIDKLKELLPSYAALYNPVDVIGDASAETIAATVTTVLHDPSVHSLLLLITPTPHVSPEEIAKKLCSALPSTDKTILSCLMGGAMAESGRTVFNASHIPSYAFPEAAMEALGKMYRQSQWTDNPLPVEINYRRDLSRAKKIIQEARADNCLELVEYQAQDILRAYEMPLLEAKLARTSDEAVKIAKQLGNNVALKIASPQIVHKTDIQGIALDLNTPDKIRAAFLDITSRAMRLRKDAYIAGCLVQAMAPKNAREVIVGFKRDSRFGPMVIFGLGGIHVEAFKDIACRLAPLSLDDVHSMIREIHAFPVLAGIRGQQPIKFTALEDILLIMSQLALDFPEIQEAECNPVFVNEKGAQVADIRILLTRQLQGSNQRHNSTKI